MALSDLRRVARNEQGAGIVVGILKQRFGERFQTGQSVREQHGHTTTYIPTQAPDGVVFPEIGGGGAGGGARLRRAPCAGDRLRHGHLAGGARQRAGRRHLPRHLAHEPCSVRACRRPRLHRRAGRDARGAQHAPARHRPVLPDRSGRGCQPGRHGRDARFRHQRRALRHDARKRAFPYRRAGRRQPDKHWQARQEKLGRLRSDTPHHRLGGHAGHHHLADAEASRHSPGDRGRRVPVPERRSGMRGGYRHDPDGHSGGAHRTGQPAADAGDEELFAARLS